MISFTCKNCGCAIRPYKWGSLEPTTADDFVAVWLEVHSEGQPPRLQDRWCDTNPTNRHRVLR